MTSQVRSELGLAQLAGRIDHLGLVPDLQDHVEVIALTREERGGEGL